jgi:hypothetical protein
MRAILAAALAAVVLACVYVALGGGAYDVAAAPDPCDARPATTGEGALAEAERVGVTALGAAACELGVPRERLLLSLARDRRLPDGVSTERAADAFRDGLRTAIDEEAAAGRLGAAEAFVLRQAVSVLPTEALLRQVFGG